MSEHALLSAEPRTPSEPKGHQMRKAGRIPGVYYNAKHDVKHVSFDSIELGRLLRKETAVIDLRLTGQTLPCVIREVQRHPVFGEVIHVDLMGVDLTQSIRVHVPVHAVGTPYGVKTQGGILDVVIYELEIECLPDAMPGHIDVDVTELKVGDSIRVEDVKLDGVTVHGDSHAVIVHVSGKKAETEEEAAAEAGGAEPEVIREKKAVEE
ncbi:MAG: 50S ribosomal protein L25 [Calditrichaeota bacterium]|nr:50S ribosomal protein L25 [Calditrichota bacterium]MCB9366852.1 50S ribosomal protein L25 [Calditrichota bacterium]